MNNRAFAYIALLFLALPVLTGAVHRPYSSTGEEILAGAAGAAILTTAAAPPIAGVPSQAQTADILVSEDAPSRDLPALTVRMKMGGAGSIPLVVNATAPNYALGTRHRFFVANVLGKGYSEIDATVRYVTPHAYWYVKDGFRVDQRRLEGSAARFESHIYPTTRRIFGPESDPGIDNDPRITVLIAPISGVGGYFSASDSFPRIVNPYSNQRDMIYMSSTPDDPPATPNNYFESTLAHEFQHMIEWNVNRDRDIWLDEGFSEAASHLNGYSTGGSDFSFTNNPDTQLNAWTDVGNSSAHYGASYLFSRYLMDRFGGEGVLGEVLRQEGLGIEAIDTALKGKGYAPGFDGAIKDWAVANALNDKNLSGGRYSYSAGGRVSPGRTLRTYPATRSDSVHQHAADYIALTGNLRTGTLTFKGNPSVRVVGADPKSGSAFWYSNRRDGGDATLTREVDLSRVRSATLRFWTWYDIENYYDYAYMAASTDGGKSWATLKGRHTTTENPNGASFGNGWTGKSGYGPGSKTTAAPKWVEESISLAPYVGRRVLLRWEYVTDEGLNKPGMVIDDISIPEIGFRDDAERDAGGWTAQGFVRIGSRVPQRWFVALVEKGIPNRVREVTVNANGEASISLTSLTNGRTSRNDLLVIMPLAPKTTEIANYTLTVRATR
jgi:immune inhibitor A